MFENPERGVRYLLVKPSDVAIYVEHGAADIGVVGKDVLLETQPDVYELLDLQLGRCRLAVAAKKRLAGGPFAAIARGDEVPPAWQKSITRRRAARSRSSG